MKPAIYPMSALPPLWGTAPVFTSPASFYGPSQDTAEFSEQGMPPERPDSGNDEATEQAHSSPDEPGRMQSGLKEARMHLPITLGMGAAMLLMNFIPSFRMTWLKAAKMSAANMLVMLGLAFGYGALKRPESGEGH